MFRLEATNGLLASLLQHRLILHQNVHEVQEGPRALEPIHADRERSVAQRQCIDPDRGGPTRTIDQPSVVGIDQVAAGLRRRRHR